MKVVVASENPVKVQASQEAFEKQFPQQAIEVVAVTAATAPGEGLAVWQSVAGTAADTRKFGIQIEFEEIDLT